MYYNYANLPKIDKNPVLVEAGTDVLVNPGTAPEELANDNKVRLYEKANQKTVFDGYKLMNYDYNQ